MFRYNFLRFAGTFAGSLGKETTHNKLNNDIGQADDPGTTAMNEFVAEILKK